MTAVTYLNVGTRSQSAGATSLTPALPASRTNGNILFARVHSKNNATHGISGAGWAAIPGLSQTNSGASFTVSWWYRIVDGTETAPTISWTGSVACAAQIVQYLRDDYENTSPFGFVGTPSTGTTSTHTSTGQNTTRANSLVLYFDDCAANTAIATPTGWTERYDAGSATGASRTSGGDKSVATSGTGSGNISVVGGATAWVQVQVELKEPLPVVPPISNTADDGYSTASAGSWVDTLVRQGSGNYAGFRFPSVAIPQGATITSATLRLVVFSASTTAAIGRYYGDNVDNAAAWSTASQPNQITKTTAFVTAATGTDEAVLDHDVSTIVQEIVNRAGWASGNALRIGGDPQSTTNAIRFYDYTTEPTKAAKLTVTFTTGGGGSTGTASITEAADTAASTAALSLTGTLARTEASDTLASTSTLAIVAALAATEADDTLVAAGQSLAALTGQAAITEADDAAAATATLAIAATAALTEANDTGSAQAILLIKGQAALSDSDDTASGSAGLAVSGSAAITEGADTLASTATISLSATADITEAADSLTATSMLLLRASLSASEANDTLTATGSLQTRGTASIVEEMDWSSGAGQLLITGELAANDNDDTLEAFGAIPLFGSAALSEADDIAEGRIGPTPTPPRKPTTGRPSGSGPQRPSQTETHRPAQLSASRPGTSTTTRPRAISTGRRR